MFLLMEDVGRNFSTSEIGNSFACSSLTNNAMDKQRLQRDSAHQLSPENPYYGILMVVVGCCRGREEVRAEFFTP